jgi:para-nitrobenzyl esterase
MLFRRVLPWLMALAAIPAEAALQKPVPTESGLVAGVSSGGITVFLGIPFAAPPVGDLRWREPRPAASWKGVRRADRFSAGCFQAKTGPFGPWSAEFIAKNAMEGGSSEDCLYLNVWTPATKAGEKRPVFVWIYGGGFNSGAADVPVYDGAGLASKGLVVVTFNYRVGVFGFLAHPALSKESRHRVSGNYGLLDMIAALEWVHRNIVGFGGDPGNVTIAGQSAGAFAVNYLIASPPAKGLFEHAIAESGASFLTAESLKLAEDQGVKVMDAQSARTPAEMRAKPADAVLSIRGVRAGPIIDGYVVPKDPYNAFLEGRQSDVPVLTGWNADDGVAIGSPLKADAFRQQAQRRFADLAAEFFKIFPSTTDEEAAAAQRAVSRDQTFAWQAREWARLQTKTGKSRIFLYYFDHTAPGTPEQTKWGAFHSGEIAYALNTLDKWERPWTAADRKLADRMSTYWVNFATHGDPNGPGVPEWPTYTNKDERLLRFGGSIEPQPIPYPAELDFFDKYNLRAR